MRRGLEKEAYQYEVITAPLTEAQVVQALAQLLEQLKDLGITELTLIHGWVMELEEDEQSADITLPLPEILPYVSKASQTGHVILGQVSLWLDAPDGFIRILLGDDQAVHSFTDDYTQMQSIRVHWEKCSISASAYERIAPNQRQFQRLW